MNKRYWVFHLVLLLAFLLAILGLMVKGPSRYWSYAVQSEFGPFGVSGDMLGTTLICGANEFTTRFGLYSLIAFILAATLFGFAVAVGVRFLFFKAQVSQSGKAGETAPPE